MNLSEKLRGSVTVHPNSNIAKALNAQGVPVSPEFRRIQALPRRVLDLANVPDVSELFRRDKIDCGAFHKPCQICAAGVKLRPIQSAMLIEATDQNGGFFPVGVGHGKTLASLLMGSAMSARRTVLLVPPNLLAQLMLHDHPMLARHFNLPPLLKWNPYNGTGTRPADAPPPNGELYAIAYSMLSSERSTDLLEKLQPDLIVADEMHNLRHKDTARTKRFIRYFQANPGCRFVGMSGTITSRSLRDYAHLIELALRKNSPVPLDWPDLCAWSDALDVDTGRNPGLRTMGPGALTMFCETDPKTGGLEPIRHGYRRRLTETPGVVATQEAACDASLNIQLVHGEKLFHPPPDVVAQIDAFTATWTIGGQETDSAAHAAKTIRRLLMGFYYRWVWPGGQPDVAWLEARNAWNRAVRQKLERSRAGSDSPALLEAMAERGEWNPPEWLNWSTMRHQPGPKTEVVWVSDYMVQAVASVVLGKENRTEPSIIWVNDPPLGWALDKIGIPYFGENSDAELALATPKKTPVIACSIRAHGTGKNLQAWAFNTILYPPPLGATWEQLLGRTHRAGQEADEVTAAVLLNSPYAVQSWESALQDAEYIQATTGQKQKLLYAKVISR